MNNTVILCLLSALLISACTTDNKNSQTDSITQTNTVSETNTVTEENTNNQTDSFTQTNTVSETDTVTDENTNNQTDSVTQTNTVSETDTDENTNTDSSTSTELNTALLSYEEDLRQLDTLLVEFEADVSLLEQNLTDFENIEQVINQAIISSETPVGVEQSTINIITDNLLTLDELDNPLFTNKDDIEIKIPAIFSFDDDLKDEINLNPDLSESEKENIIMQFSLISSEFELQIQKANQLVLTTNTKDNTISDLQLELTQLTDQLALITSQIDSYTLLISSLKTQSENITLIAGEKGDTGIQGLQGEQGARGDTGLSWSSGYQQTVVNRTAVPIKTLEEPGLFNYDNQLYYLELRQDAVKEIQLLLKEMEIEK